MTSFQVNGYFIPKMTSFQYYQHLMMSIKFDAIWLKEEVSLKITWAALAS